MENITSPKTDALLTLLVERVDTNRADLISRYQRILRETLFTNRAEVRPNTLNNIAVDEAESLRNFLSQPAFSGAERGKQQYHTGLGEQVVLRLGQVTRQFFLPYLENGQIAPMLEIVDAYQEALIHGYVQSLEKNIFTEQERTYQALQRARGQG